MIIDRLDGFNKMDDLLSLVLFQVAELDNRFVGIARTAFISTAVPHNGYEYIASTAVVKPFHTAAALGSQATSPKRGGTAPACTTVVLHPETVLHEVGLGPDFLVRITRHIAV